MKTKTMFAVMFILFAFLMLVGVGYGIINHNGSIAGISVFIGAVALFATALFSDMVDQ